MAAAPHCRRRCTAARVAPVGEPDIRGSAAFPARQRLAVYAQSYALRLIECLREEFPVLRLLVGDQVFDLFAGAYIAAQPSRSYSLYGPPAQRMLA